MNCWNANRISSSHSQMRRMGAARLCVALAGAWVFLPAAAWAGEKALPKAETVLDKYIEATGGKSAYKKLHNRISKGRIEMPAQGFSMSVTTYAAEPNSMLVISESEGMGTFTEGTDGKVAWSVNMMGPQVKEGVEREQAIRNAVFQSELEWRKLYKKFECVGEETVHDKPCYKLEVTPGAGPIETHFYDKDSNLLVKKNVVMSTAMGEMPLEMEFADYTKVDGVLIPFKVMQRVAFQEVNMILESIEHNVDMPKDRFEPPEEIKALLAKAKTEDKQDQKDE